VRPADPGRRGQPYIKRLQRLASIRITRSYDHPSLEPVLRDTLGAIIFQDQVSRSRSVRRLLSGQGRGLAAGMSRRAGAAMEAYRDFVAGAVARHCIDDALPSGCGTWSRLSQASASPRPWRGLRSARYQSPGACALRRSCCARCSTSSRWLLSARRARARAQRRGIDVSPPTSTPVRRNARGRSAAGRRRQPPRVRVGLGFVSGCQAEEVAAITEARDRAGRSAARPTWPGPARARLARALAWAAHATGSAAAGGAPPCGGSGSPLGRRPAGACAAAASSPCRSGSGRAGAAGAERMGADARRLRGTGMTLAEHRSPCCVRRCRRGRHQHGLATLPTLARAGRRGDGVARRAPQHGSIVMWRS